MINWNQCFHNYNKFGLNLRQGLANHQLEKSTFHLPDYDH